MTDSLTQLRTALDDYFAAVAAQGKPDAPDLMKHFTRLDALETELGTEAPPDLRHYLQQKSYRKAWLWLQDRQAEITRGACGRGS